MAAWRSFRQVLAGGSKRLLGLAIGRNSMPRNKPYRGCRRQGCWPKVSSGDDAGLAPRRWTFSSSPLLGDGVLHRQNRSAGQVWPAWN